MKSYMAKAENVERKWFVVDAEGKVLGRLASEVATILRGKHKAEYTPHVDVGDYVIIINAEKVVLTGNKWDDKMYRYHTGYIGGLKEIPYKHFVKKNPRKLVELAVKGMLPKNSLGRDMFRKLKVYAGNEHPHQAQTPQPLEI
ncbi:MAG TPA: 50S ribosomal protein L13 [Clostridiales bacterium]|nr:50S ribosomal protein L13 [Clostridiales bacterium]